MALAKVIKPTLITKKGKLQEEISYILVKSLQINFFPAQNILMILAQKSDPVHAKRVIVKSLACSSLYVSVYIILFFNMTVNIQLTCLRKGCN